MPSSRQPTENEFSVSLSHNVMSGHFFQSSRSFVYVLWLPVLYCYGIAVCVSTSVSSIFFDSFSSVCLFCSIPDLFVSVSGLLCFIIYTGVGSLRRDRKGMDANGR